MNDVPVCPYCRSIGIKDNHCQNGHKWEGTWKEEIERLRSLARQRNPGIEELMGQDMEMKFNSKLVA